MHALSWHVPREDFYPENGNNEISSRASNNLTERTHLTPQVHNRIHSFIVTFSGETSVLTPTVCHTAALWTETYAQCGFVLFVSYIKYFLKKSLFEARKVFTVVPFISTRILYKKRGICVAFVHGVCWNTEHEYRSWKIHIFVLLSS